MINCDETLMQMAHLCHQDEHCLLSCEHILECLRADGRERGFRHTVLEVLETLGMIQAGVGAKSSKRFPRHEHQVLFMSNIRSTMIRKHM